jgi:hypothetical protein
MRILTPASFGAYIDAMKPLRTPAYQQKRPRKTIRLDRIHPSDFQKYVWPQDGTVSGFFCEACAHFSPSTGKCSFGYPTQHRRELQLKLYEQTGHMALCRAIEVD